MVERLLDLVRYQRPPLLNAVIKRPFRLYITVVSTVPQGREIFLMEYESRPTTECELWNAGLCSPF